MPPITPAKRGSGSQINSGVRNQRGWVNRCFLCGRTDWAHTEERIRAIARAHYRRDHYQPEDQ